MIKPLIDGACYRALAVAVLRRAVLDLEADQEQVRRGAERFLTEGGRMADLWASLAGVDRAAVARLARRAPGRPAGLDRSDDATTTTIGDPAGPGET